MTEKLWRFGGFAHIFFKITFRNKKNTISHFAHHYSSKQTYISSDIVSRQNNPVSHTNLSSPQPAYPRTSLQKPRNPEKENSNTREKRAGGRERKMTHESAPICYTRPLPPPVARAAVADSCGSEKRVARLASRPKSPRANFSRGLVAHCAHVPVVVAATACVHYAIRRLNRISRERRAERGAAAPHRFERGKWMQERVCVYGAVGSSRCWVVCVLCGGNGGFGEIWERSCGAELLLGLSLTFVISREWDYVRGNSGYPFSLIISYANSLYNV